MNALPRPSIRIDTGVAATKRSTRKVEPRTTWTNRSRAGRTPAPSDGRWDSDGGDSPPGESQRDRALEPVRASQSPATFAVDIPPA